LPQFCTLPLPLPRCPQAAHLPPHSIYNSYSLAFIPVHRTTSTYVLPDIGACIMTRALPRRVAAVAAVSRRTLLLLFAGATAAAVGATPTAKALPQFSRARAMVGATGKNTVDGLSAAAAFMVPPSTPTLTTRGRRAGIATEMTRWSLIRHAKGTNSNDKRLAGAGGRLGLVLPLPAATWGITRHPGQ